MDRTRWTNRKDQSRWTDLDGLDKPGGLDRLDGLKELPEGRSWTEWSRTEGSWTD